MEAIALRSFSRSNPNPNWIGIILVEYGKTILIQRKVKLNNRRLRNYEHFF